MNYPIRYFRCGRMFAFLKRKSKNWRPFFTCFQSRMWQLLSNAIKESFDSEVSLNRLFRMSLLPAELYRVHVDLPCWITSWCKAWWWWWLWWLSWRPSLRFYLDLWICAARHYIFQFLPIMPRGIIIFHYEHVVMAFWLSCHVQYLWTGQQPHWPFRLMWHKSPNTRRDPPTLTANKALVVQQYQCTSLGNVNIAVTADQATKSTCLMPWPLRLWGADHMEPRHCRGLRFV
jgi:hypothetical protein